MKIATARRPEVPGGVARVVMLAVPDPLPLATQVLAAYARTLPVDVVVHAPATESAHFDAWGRPAPDAWARRVLDLPAFMQRVHLCADPAAQAGRLVAHARAYPNPEGKLAIGVADPDLLAPVETALRAAGMRVFNPDGRARREEGFHHLLIALASLARMPDFAAVSAVARCPEIIAWLEAKIGQEFSAAQWLAGLDELHARHLPPDLPAALRQSAHLRDYPALGPALDWLGRLRAALTTGTFGESVAAALSELHGADKVPHPPAWTDGVVAWMELVRDCAELERRHAATDRADWWQLALGLYGETRQPADKPPGALELQGWLELAWEDSPHLVVAGCNDGRVPDAVAGDAFLPESLRVRLGLKSNEARFARDAFLLQGLAASRAEDGRLDLLYGKFTAEGEPLRPSRLLLRCPDPDLPARVNFLFRPPDLHGPALAWRRAWKLRLPRRAPPARVSVTALKRWLRCPLRFYLQHVLGMEAVDPEKTELDAFDFGTLCHGALEAMGRDPAMCDSTEAEALREFLLAEFDRQMRIRFGRELTLPLLVQQESARQRLAKAAEVQARERAAGWRIVQVERKFELPVEGMVIAGKIDRIERHVASGRWRVLDYKTSDTAMDPATAHLRNVRRGEDPPPWSRYASGSQQRLWIDLQLPLYRRVLAAEAEGAPVDCAYFNLPKAIAETGLRAWTDFTPDLEESAWACAQGVIQAIGAGAYWPPRELMGREGELDDFAPLFHGSAAESMEWEDAKP